MPLGLVQTVSRSCARLSSGIALLCLTAIPDAHAAGLAYPAAPRSAQVERHFGIEVADPWRPLEETDAPATRAWVEAEAALSSRELGALPGRELLATRLHQLWNYPRWTPPEHHGRHWYHSRNDGLQNQPVVRVSKDPEGDGQVLLDPNSLSRDGTMALSETSFSDDGRWMAYALAEAGSDWMQWHVRDLRTGRDLPDVLSWCKFGEAAWRKDGSGFFYSAYTAPEGGDPLKSRNEYQKLMYHRLGTPQARDILIYMRSDAPDWYVDGSVSEDGRWLLIRAAQGTSPANTLLVADLRDAHPKPRALVPRPIAEFRVLGVVGKSLYLRTDQDAPRYRVIAIDLSARGTGRWRTVVPEDADTLTAASLAGGQLVLSYLHDAHALVRRHALDGHLLGDVELPGLGSVSGFRGQAKDQVVWYSYQSYTAPPSVWQLDLRDGISRPWRAPVLNGFDPAQYETRQVFYSSRDGTRVPMFLMFRRGTEADGKRPTLLYGYGGFNISLDPRFSPALAAWLDQGGVYAVANLRGGGEYGRAWHEAGTLTRKQNVFDDFIAAAEYLQAEHWTSPERLAILGRSNGGLLVAAVEQQRPELFAAVIAYVGVLDMLRFREFTVGRGWESDYGSVDREDQFRALLAYSPYHQVRSGVDYPATLILTGDHDDRVFPAHSFKYAAAMQAADPAGRPILLRVDLRTGHGAGKPVAKQIEEIADVYAFTLNAMGLAPAAAPGSDPGAHRSCC